MDRILFANEYAYTVFPCDISMYWHLVWKGMTRVYIWFIYIPGILSKSVSGCCLEVSRTLGNADVLLLHS